MKPTKRISAREALAKVMFGECFWGDTSEAARDAWRGEAGRVARSLRRLGFVVTRAPKRGRK